MIAKGNLSSVFLVKNLLEDKEYAAKIIDRKLIYEEVKFFD